MRHLLLTISILLATFASQHPASGQWPQILGPERNGVAQNETLLDAWPAGGPEQLWQVELGEGFGGPVVSGGKVIAFHRPGNSEHVTCFDAATGKQSWTTSFPARYRGGINPDSGPRATPVIAGERVVVYGPSGDMHCLKLADGEKLWSQALLEDYDAQEGYFGAGSSPVVIGNRVLVNVGGRNGAAIVALDMANGKTLWTAYNDTASYSSPAVLPQGEGKAAVFVTRLNCVAVNPADGKVLFDFPFGSRGPTVNAATPLVIGGNRLFLTASYGIGARYVKIDGGEVKTLWSNDQSLSSQYTTPVHVAGVLYGTHGREDIGVASLRAVSVDSGEVLWEKPEFGVAHVIAVGDKLLIMRNDGQLVLAVADREAYKPLACTVRAVPALADGRLYIRSSGQGRGALTCVKVGKTD